MEQFLHTVRKNERLIFLCLPVLMAVIFAFFPVADVLGKTTANGLKLIFEGKGFGLGRLCAILSVAIPVAAVVLQFVSVKMPEKVAANFTLIWTALALFTALLMTATFPDGVSMAWGGYIYCLLGAAGLVISILLKR